MLTTKTDDSRENCLIMGWFKMISCYIGDEQLILIEAIFKINEILNSFRAGFQRFYLSGEY